MSKQPQSFEEAGIKLRNSYAELGKAVYEAFEPAIKAVGRFCIVIVSSVRRRGR